MTAAASRPKTPMALPDNAQAFADLIGEVDWVIISEEVMVAAGVDPSIAHMFFANFAAGQSIRLSELAVHMSRRHADWRPATIKTAHHVLFRDGMVIDQHDPGRCGFCQSFVSRT